MEITAPAALALGQPPTAHAQLLAILSCGGDAQFDRSIERMNHRFRAQNGLPRCDVEFTEEIRLAGCEIRMSGVANPQVKITGRSTAMTRFAMARNADSAPIDDTGRDAHLKRCNP